MFGQSFRGATFDRVGFEHVWVILQELGRSSIISVMDVGMVKFRIQPLSNELQIPEIDHEAHFVQFFAGKGEFE
jgi:hypothetical protein